MDPLAQVELDQPTINDLAELEALLADMVTGPHDPKEVARFHAMIADVRQGRRLRVIFEGSEEVMFLTPAEIETLKVDLDTKYAKSQDGLRDRTAAIDAMRSDMHARMLADDTEPLPNRKDRRATASTARKV